MIKKKLAVKTYHATKGPDFMLYFNWHLKYQRESYV